MSPVYAVRWLALLLLTACGGPPPASASKPSPHDDPAEDTANTPTEPDTTITTPTGTTGETGALTDTGPGSSTTFIPSYGGGPVISAIVTIDGVTYQPISPSGDPFNPNGLFFGGTVLPPPAGGCTESRYYHITDNDGPNPLLGGFYLVEQTGIPTAQRTAPYGGEEPPFSLRIDGVTHLMSGGDLTYTWVAPGVHQFEWSNASLCVDPPFEHDLCTPVGVVTLDVIGTPLMSTPSEGVPSHLPSSVPGVPLCVWR